MKNDYWDLKSAYDVLEVPRDATQEAIRKAYGFLSHIWHPDSNPHRSEGLQRLASERMQRITEAYACLTDPERRRRLDAMLGPEVADAEVFPLPIQNQPSVWKKLAKWLAYEDVGSGFQRRMAYRAGDYLERLRCPSEKEFPHMMRIWDLALENGFQPEREYDFD